MTNVILSYDNVSLQLNINSSMFYLGEKWIVEMVNDNAYINLIKAAELANKYGIPNLCAKSCTVEDRNRKQNAVLHRSISSLRVYEGMYISNLFLIPQFPKPLFKPKILNIEDEDMYLTELFGTVKKDIALLRNSNIDYAHDGIGLVYIETSNLRYVNYFARIFIHKTDSTRLDFDKTIKKLESVTRKRLYSECNLYKDRIKYTKLYKSGWFDSFLINENRIEYKESEYTTIDCTVNSSTQIILSTDNKARSKDFYECMKYDLILNTPRIQALLNSGITIKYKRFSEYIPRIISDLANHNITTFFNLIGHDFFQSLMANVKVASLILLECSYHKNTNALEYVIKNDSIRNQEAYTVLAQRLSNRVKDDPTILLCYNLTLNNLFLNRDEPVWKEYYVNGMWEKQVLTDKETHTGQFNISKQILLKLNSWILDVNITEKLTIQTTVIGMSLFARYYTVANVSNKNIQKYACACLYIASILDNNSISRTQLAYLSDGGFTREKLTSATFDVLTSLKGKIVFPSLIDFMDLLDKKVSSIDWDVVASLLYLLCLDPCAFSYLASDVTMSIVYYYCNNAGIRIDMSNFNHELVHYIAHVFEDIVSKVSQNNQLLMSGIAFVRNNTIKTSDSIPLSNKGVSYNVKLPSIYNTDGEEIGGGSYGTVIKIKQGMNVYAIKKQDKIYYEPFIIEVGIMRTFTSDNVQSCVSFDKIEDDYLLMMKLARGTLKDEIYMYTPYKDSLVYYKDVWIDGTSTPKTLSLRLRRKYLTHILQGLSYLHSNGIIHTDLKPVNILIGTDGIARVSDYGTSQPKCSGYSDYTNRTCKVVTFWYRDMNMHVDGCNYYSFDLDIWAVAIILMEMWTCVIPTFESQDEEGLFRRQLSLIASTKWHNHFEDNIVELLLRMLDPVRNNRPTADMCIASL